MFAIHRKISLFVEGRSIKSKASKEPSQKRKIKIHSTVVLPCCTNALRSPTHVMTSQYCCSPAQLALGRKGSVTLLSFQFRKEGCVASIFFVSYHSSVAFHSTKST